MKKSLKPYRDRLSASKKMFKKSVSIQRSTYKAYCKASVVSEIFRIKELQARAEMAQAIKENQTSNTIP